MISMTISYSTQSLPCAAFFGFGCFYLKLMMKRVSEAIRPNRFASGTLSKMDSLKNIIRTGINIPPPPSPPALDKNPIKKNTRAPTISRRLYAYTNSFFSNMTDPTTA
jgi:hypothetical protein